MRKQMWTRIVSLVLTLVLMMTAMPEFLQTAAAAAVDLADAISSGQSIGELGDLITLGEWLYSVDGNGQAVVKGYDNVEERSLNVPYTLGSNVVVGIADGAFAQNTALTSITLSSYVTSIGQDIFGDRANVVIRAYSGSFALSYAAEHGYPSVNLTNENNPIHTFANGLIDMAGFPDSAYYVNDYEGIAVDKQISKLIHQGSYVYVPSLSNGVDVFAACVAEKRDYGDRTLLVLCEPQYPGYVLVQSQLHDITLELDPSTIKTAPGVELVEDSVEAEGQVPIEVKPFTKSKTFSINFTVPVWQKVIRDGSLFKKHDDDTYQEHIRKLEASGNVNVSGSLTTSHTFSASAVVTYGAEMNWPPVEIGLKSFEFTHVEKTTHNLKITGSIDYTKEIFTATWSDPATGFMLEGTIKVKFTFEGGIEFFYEVSKTQKTVLENGKFVKKTPVVNTVGPTVNITGEFGITPSIKAGIKWGFKLWKWELSVEFASATLSVAFKATAKWLYIDTANPCVDVSAKIQVSIEGKIGLLSVKCGDKKWPIALTLWSDKYTFPPLLQQNWHWDYDGDKLKKVAKCLRNSREIQYRDDWQSRKTFTTAYGNASTTIKAPSSKPNKAGYEFIGWCYNGITKDGKPVAWNFSVDRLPYLSDPNAIHIFYPIWKDKYPVTKITLNKPNQSGLSGIGETFTLKTTSIQPENANNKSVRWWSSNSSVAQIVQSSEKGTATIKLKKAGTATIYCGSVGNPDCKPAECTVTVRQNVETVSLNTTSVFRYSDNMAPVQLKATVGPSNAIDKSVTWSSSNKNVATVDQNGKVTLVGLGTATITCRSNLNTSKAATCSIAVRQAVTGIELDQETHSRTNANMSPIKLNATVSPANAYNKTLKWETSDSKVAVVNQAGVVTPKGLGTAVITCRSESNPGITDTFTITITQAVTKIELNEKAVTRYSDEKEAIQLVPTVLPVNAHDKSVTWETTDASVVKVSANGSVTVCGAGKADIICRSVSDPDVTGVCHFTILQAVTAITLNRTEIDTSKDAINPIYLTAEVLPANAHNKAVVWESSDPSVAEVTANGVVLIRGLGDAEISCTSVSPSYIREVCTVHVTQGVRRVQLNYNTYYCYSNQRDAFQLMATLDAAEVSDQEISWSTDNPAVATVSVSGIVTVHSMGEAVITCTSISNPDAYASCKVISLQSVTDIELNRHEITRKSDDMTPVQLTASVLPAHADNKELIWFSSNENVAAVNDQGLVTLTGVGTAVITVRSVSDPGVEDTCTVSVTQTVEGLRLSSTKLVCYSNDPVPQKLTAYVLPDYAEDISVQWSSDNAAVASVSANGTVTIGQAGTAVITCRSVAEPTISATCTVTVKQSVTSITLDQTEIVRYINEMDDIQLYAKVLPANADDPSVLWRSSNEAVASVSDKGLVTLNGVGTAMISCTSLTNETVQAHCMITVYQSVTGITLNETDLVCYSSMTDSIQLVADVQPDDAENKAVVWSTSNNGVAAVSEAGVLTVTGAGEAVITCTSTTNPEITAQCHVTVLQAITNITLDQTELSLYSDDETGAALTASILPDNADDDALIWETSNSSVAIVSDAGVVLPITPGTAEITCTSVNNPAVYAVGRVTVLERTAEIYVEGTTESLLIGETTTLTAKVYPETANDRRVRWSSDDERIAVVDQNGTVTAVGYGTVIIRAATQDGSEAEGTYTITVTHELTLKTYTIFDTVYTQGTEDVGFAYVMPDGASVRRMKERGYDLVWTLNNADGEVELIEKNGLVYDKDESFETTYAVLHGADFAQAGSRSYTVTCTAGEYTETVTIPLFVDDTVYAVETELESPTIMVECGEEVSLPETLVSVDGYPMPAGMKLTDVNGDRFWQENARMNETDDGFTVMFDRSGIYTAKLSFTAANMLRTANLTVYVLDESGMIRIRAEEVTLNATHVELLQGDTFALTAAVLPNDATDSSVTWSVSDENVITVDANGVVTAVNPGMAAVFCTSNDPDGVGTMCTFTVERFLQLYDNEVSYTVYRNGNNHAELGSVSLTYASEARLANAGMNVTWTLEKLNGTACDLTVEEYRTEEENGIAVSGNKLRLLRVNDLGTDTYRLTCHAGSMTDSCEISITVVDGDLPDAISLKKNDYTGKTNEVITVDTTVVGGTLPEDMEITVEGGRVFNDALSDDYSYFNPEQLIFSEAGVYQAEVVFSGSNYRYACPITITVTDENGHVPVNVTALSVDPQIVYLTPGERVQLNAVVEPANADYSAFSWSTSDSSVASVSSKGWVTAIGTGMALVNVTVPEFDYAGGCLVVVEDGLNLQTEAIDRTVYVDGITRVSLGTAQLTASSSSRLTEAPEWKLSRVSGDNLTLRLNEYNTRDALGSTIYGCEVILYSMSRKGIAEYELSCTSGNDTVTMPVTVRVVDRDEHLASAITLTQTTMTASVNELIIMQPEIVCMPAGTVLPDGLVVDLRANELFMDAVNAEDSCVSRSVITMSFNRAGLFEAELVYTCSNIRYIVPVTFRIMDENGNVPILSTGVTLSSKSLWMVKGETQELSAVFTPADADNKAVTWRSTNEAVAVVDANGHVTAMQNGEAYILCTPDDPYLNTMICPVWVEDELAVEYGSDAAVLYRQGDQEQEVFSAILTEGTLQRLKKNGVTPEWSLERVSGSHADIVTQTNAAGDLFTIRTAVLGSGGTDVYRVVCRAGEAVWQHDFTLEIMDLANAAVSVAPAAKSVSLSIGEKAVLDFTPVCAPAGSSIPENDEMWDLYVVMGKDYLKAMDWDEYAENGDFVTVRFTQPGRYLITRQYFLGNLHYAAICEVNVGASTDPIGVFKADTMETVVYLGGTSGCIASFELLDDVMVDVYENGLEWTAERISGSSLLAAVKPTVGGAELVAINALQAGDDVWRVTCTFGEHSESVDITVHVREPRSLIPETVTLAVNELSGRMGDWLYLPIAANCQPDGSALPENGDTFWSFQPQGTAEGALSWKVEDGLLKVLGYVPGYYEGTLTYRAGSFHYDFPVYLAIADEEGVLPDPAVELTMTDSTSLVYLEGSADITVATAVLQRGANRHYTGEACAWLKNKSTEWTVTVTAGNAAELTIEPLGLNSAALVLKSMKGEGTVRYTAVCTVEGTSYSANGSVTVTAMDGKRPDPALGRTTYYARVGQPVVIPTMLYERGTGAELQSHVTWNPGALLADIGYEYTHDAEKLQMTFYREGTYTSDVDARIGNLMYRVPFTVVVSQSGEETYTVMVVPRFLEQIEDQAFEGSGLQAIDLRASRVSRIGSRAFGGCSDLQVIYIPEGVTSIASDAFEGCRAVTIVCAPSSAADTFAGMHGIPVRYE